MVKLPQETISVFHHNHHHPGPVNRNHFFVCASVEVVINLLLSANEARDTVSWAGHQFLATQTEGIVEDSPMQHFQEHNLQQI